MITILVPLFNSMTVRPSLYITDSSYAHFITDRYFTTQMEPMDATVAGVSLSQHEPSDPTSPSSN